MIKINLLGSQIEKNPNTLYFTVGWAGGLIIFLIICILWKCLLIGNIATLEDTNAKLKVQLASLEEKTKEVKNIDAVKKDLSDKLSVIAILKKNKLGPVKVLDDLNLAVPNKIWLESLEEKAGTFTIKGKSLDDQSLSLFMRSLESSKYFSNVDLNYSKQFLEKGIKIKDFEVKATVNYAGTITNALTTDNKTMDN